MPCDPRMKGRVTTQLLADEGGKPSADGGEMVCDLRSARRYQLPQLAPGVDLFITDALNIATPLMNIYTIMESTESSDSRWNSECRFKVRFVSEDYR